nr:sarcolemmal membrane-associated protein isoform X2 [Bactrocera oleae]XP_014087325.2 sarcolemmal membrane-associated protein isoform X2 [Bactrocera oleae]XP_014087333.2 sarcolemmal membrane-associated protein isoform X2 [Bactrocera oleae]XP_014087349.2 sarcolemmal membrane-associated protein isoform X2 [Bactrocera oleae]XP_014087358.2 sarcolemmal membrane-associated protein isoform X2 [Bactrocera oleae]XP_014087368.2 sarcolemmal membrane-associated protein isoform X2 [Bactrocera oleae]XP_03
MVLASNEWLNNSEDEQKRTSGSTQTATATNTTDAGNRDIAGTTEVLARTTEITSTNNTAIPAVPITAPVTTTGTANANNEIMSENPNSESHEQQEQLAQQLKNNINDILPAANNEANDEVSSTREVVNNNREVLNCDTSNTNANTANANSNINSSISDNSGENGSITNANESSAQISNSNTSTNNANLYSNPSSNASTLQSPIVRQSKAVTITTGTALSGGNLPLSSPITPQALSSALQSVMNASNNVNSANAAVGNLQNTFLNTIGMDIGQAAKELGTAFVSGLVEAQTNITNNGSNAVQNVGTSSNASMNLETAENNGQAKIILLCEANSHPFQTRTINLTPNIECKVGRLIAKSKASESNAIFDCKVLSRNHAVLWYTDDCKFWVKDTKSSNGTFINENKLGTEAAELHFGDIVKFGVDVLENSRKEVHGCIIAFVKLYLPDGREAISIDATAQRSQYSGEDRISYEEMHRLNLYMQEVSQREKALKSKLFNIQNVLDATRKNSALCWQSLIAEDQLLHRINSLEKKLQIMEKNVPESVLRNEVIKLLEDKNSYQLTAKEALRKVYQERCDALQMLSKMELAYANSDGECKILRDQIMNTKQSLQDVNTRLQRLETDYNEYKEDAERKQQEIKEQEEHRLAEMSEKLHQREQECDDLRRRVSEFMLQRAELVDEEEKRAIEKLDAAIGDMDLGDDDDDDNEVEENDDNEDNEDKFDEGDGEHKEDGNEKDSSYKELRSSRVTKSLEIMNGVGTQFSHSNDEKEVLNSTSRSDVSQKEDKQKSNAKESTILKWLQNSDLNQKEGSIDIFKAICNESDSSDEQDLPLLENDVVIDSESGIGTSMEDIKLKYKKSKNKLQSVQSILCQLVEAEMSKEFYKSPCANTTEHNAADSENEALKETRNEGGCAPMDNEQKLLLLKRSVAILSEAYKEICDNLNEHELQKALIEDAKELSPPPAITVQTQFQSYAPSFNTSATAANKLIPQDTLKPLIEAAEDEDDLVENKLQTEQTANDEAQSEECVTVTTPSTIVANVIAGEEVTLRDEVRAYKGQIKELNLKLEQVESDAQNTLEIMQIECDTYKEKLAELSKVVQKACEEKQELELLLDKRAVRVENVQLQAEQQRAALDEHSDAETKVPVSVAELSTEVRVKETASTLPERSGVELQNADNKPYTASTLESDFETQLHDDLAALNSSALQREEELIVYKERLEKTQNDNLQLRNEMAELLLKSGTQAQTHMVKQLLAYGVVVVAIIVYFITMYF